ncbi:MAG: XrtA/PEP-CTERM system histidine kinase PrsK, partial [Chthoniobacterales bacterium]
MDPSVVLCYAAAVTSGLLAVVALFQKQRSPARWWFAAGMLVFAIESVLNALSFGDVLLGVTRWWQMLAMMARSFLPGIWLCFSLTYSRGDYQLFFRRWRLVIVAAFLLPLLPLIWLQGEFLYIHPQEQGGRWLEFVGPVKILNALLLLGAFLVLTNLEKTFRAAVGTMQWRIKFLILGVGIIFGAQIYTRCQAVLLSGHSLSLLNIESAALLIGCGMIAIGYRRSGFGAVDVYPSRAVLHTSFTVLLAGAYLFFVGVLAQIVARRGGSGNFQAQAFVVLVGIALLAVLLLSDRVRRRTRAFISRHFKRPEHDFREIWTAFTRSVSSVLDQTGVCEAAAKLLSNTFNALSVSVWLFDESTQRLTLAASTAQSSARAREVVISAGEFDMPPTNSRPLDLEKAREKWAETLRRAAAGIFPEGGNRLCVPLLVRDRWLGVVILADRVSAAPYTLEEIDLLQCVGDQLSASLLNVRLTAEILQGRELEAFRTMSTFFVHDLKNAASTLNLTLQNLPLHFDDPAFRTDALRGIGKTVSRINQLIERLGILRQKLAVDAVELDLNSLVEQTLQDMASTPEVELQKELNPVPQVVADREQLHSVFTNLLLNARDAVLPKGRVSVRTGTLNGWAVVTVADNGCGMSPAFLRDSLFRPFKTTKKNGLGIGMFQSKMIVEAHGGNIQVESETGAGTTFRVLLP